MSLNTAAFITGPKVHPLEVKAAPLGEPGNNQIMIINRALAINPIDHKLQYLAVYPLDYPNILGQDVAGEVISVGPSVARFKPGDRVIGSAAGMLTKKAAEKAFQAYTVLDANLASRIPSTISFEKAVVLPLAITTASAGLFHPDHLNLQLPSVPAKASTGQAVLVWGGASSVGSAAIQLAVAAGYEVFTTASEKNFNAVKKLGASQVFDYNKASVARDLVAALSTKSLAGAFDAIGGAAWAPTVQVVQESNGTKRVATVLRGFSEPPAGISMTNVFSLVILNHPVSKAVWADFLPHALEAGTFVPYPEPFVAGTGLESVQTGIDLLRKGVSAQKIIVTL